MIWSVWIHTSGQREAIVVEATLDHVGLVYDRVANPDGPSAQYAVQRLSWGVFRRTHMLKLLPGERLH